MLRRPWIRSFVLRGGRLSNAQRRALDSQRAWLLAPEGDVALSQLYSPDIPLVLEIGCGMGDATVAIAQTNPDKRYLAVEVYLPGVGTVLQKIEQMGLNNLWMVRCDVMALLQGALQDNSLSAVHVFFPDPWPRKRHHKRRLVDDAFVQHILPKLKKGGYLHCATDWEDYAFQMLDCLLREPGFCNVAHAQHGFLPRPDPQIRPMTKFEQRGLKLGHGIWDLKFKKK